MALGVASALFLVVVGLVTIIRRQKSKKIEPKNSENIPLEGHDQEVCNCHSPDDSYVDICNRKFPKSIVREWNHIKCGEEKIGSGNFGNVYKGFLYLSDFQRYVLYSVTQKDLNDF